MKKILIIEDNEDIRSNTAEILQLSNYKVIEAADGKTGIEKAIEHKPDLIICDIMMPGLDGYGVLHAIHKNEAIKNTPFIFLTAKTERSDFRKGMELGADDYITKPFSGTELLNAVDSRLKKLDQLKQHLAPGLQGLEQLMQASTGNTTLSSFTKDRDTNKYKKKQTIYAEGNHPNKLYYILKGKIKTYKSNEDGKELVTGLFGAGEFIGYIALLEGATYKDTAEAIDETELAVIPKEDFDELLNKNTAVSKKFMELLAGNISEKENQLLGLAYHSLRKKVADALLMLKKKYHHNKAEKFTIDMNRESLASMAGTATESFIRTLSDFRHEKIIDITDGIITITDPLKLEQMLN
ncbi:response regulator [Panacibacter ginsenosidivorans]|uniref:Response regulator n=1 Tax=Panacibacter ginsenosidivorans TaxID=1813871 RepID=A0A5B8V2Q2_9BACT|nr:response regulator [Panacibacter ginsenosidivorans]QEC65787.1 response regulator [Panacibacter ginsenosidivorans]